MYAYASDLTKLFKPYVRLWAFGHTHCPADIQLRGLRLVSNPKGYVSQELEWHPERVIEVSPGEQSAFDEPKGDKCTIA